MNPREILDISRIPINITDWLVERKYDGVRGIVYIESHEKVRIETANRRNITSNFPELKTAFSLIGVNHSAIFDGEIIHGEGKSRDDRQNIINRVNSSAPRIEEISEAEIALYFAKVGGVATYKAFDILYYDGKDLRGLPLLTRKRLLRHVLDKKTRDVTDIHLVAWQRKNQHRFAEAARKRKDEGVVFKNVNSPYIAAHGNRNWLKLRFARS